MDEQRLCNECGRYVSLYKKEPRYVGGHGYLEWITCFSCQKKTQQESSAAVEELKDKVKMGKLDAIRRLLEEYADNHADMSSVWFAREIHKLYTGKESE